MESCLTSSRNLTEVVILMGPDNSGEMKQKSGNNFTTAWMVLTLTPLEFQEMKEMTYILKSRDPVGYAIRWRHIYQKHRRNSVCLLQTARGRLAHLGRRSL